MTILNELTERLTTAKEDLKKIQAKLNKDEVYRDFQKVSKEIDELESVLEKIQHSCPYGNLPSMQQIQAQRFSSK